MAYSETYRQMTRLLMQAADTLCSGRLVLSHEGGYSAAYVPFCGLAVMEELSGVATGVEDPFRKPIEAMTGHALYPHQETVIAVAAELAAQVS
jgi:acetoin utilization deacetylase AcuC-like enzyme